MKFSRRSRLLKPAQFRLVFKDPIRSDDNYFRVLARNNGEDQHRLGMAVSKKVCARAVDRNRVKRVIRECFRNCVGGHTGAGTLDFVVLPKHRVVGENNSMLDNSLTNHWQRLICKAESLQARTQT